jgi:glycosyltransferase involved in cell wall biosynthesis
MKKKILIDANPIVPYYALGTINGIGRTCIELIKAIDKIRDVLPFEIELYTQNLKGISGKRLETGFKSNHAYLRNNQLGLILAKKLHVREILSNYTLQHITHNCENVVDPSRCIVTIHDAMYYSYPEDMFNPEDTRRKYSSFAKRAKRIITISENSKREIMHYMDIPDDKISVIPWGVDRELLYPHKPTSNKYCGSAPYFVAVSCDIGRKNTISILKAYKKFALNNPSHHLILVWRNPSEEALEISKLPGLNGFVHFASNLTNEELSDIYAGATASFFPSLYEGFGLPILESMACGIPCVTCQNSSLPEVGGDAAIYVEPLDTDGMSQIMERFENGEYDIDDLKDKSLLQASKFSWENCAKQTAEIYRQCLGI